MREVFWWSLLAVGLAALFVILFALLMWMWSVTSLPRTWIATFGTLAIFCVASAFITINFGDWLRRRHED